MCGIAGFVGRGDQDTLQIMIDTLRHRGPDDQGVFVSDNIGLAHARLSILDLSTAGHQPMFSADKKIAVVFNGEIYNFLELKTELVKLNKYKFTSHTDTEVIIYGYQEWGEGVFAKLNGMFAIALYDRQQNKLVLARDRLGQKPLYYGVFGDTLIFASELKAIVKHPLFQKQLDLSAVNKYLFYEYVPTPQTIWQNISKLEPATFLVWQNKQVAKKQSFWQTSFSDKKISLTSATEQFDKLLSTSVQRRLLSDVPVGIFLSGGLDSSTIAYYAQQHSQEKIKTFSVGFHESSFDESEYAKQVADFLGTDHHHQFFQASDTLDLVPKIADIIDEPMADASILPTFLLSQFTRQKVTVALGGDGSDELLAGYGPFLAHKFAGVYKSIPAPMRHKFLEKIFCNLPTGEKYFSLDFKIKSFIRGFQGDFKYIHSRWLSSFDQERGSLWKKELAAKLMPNNIFAHIDDYLQETQIADPNQAAVYTYLRTYLLDGILVKVDRASMQHSLEVRSPFLDHELVDFVNNLPYNYKHRFLTGKYLLKRTMKDKLPDNIINRSKKGFGIPLTGWLKHELKDLCQETLSAKNTKDINLFDYQYIEQLKNRHFAGKQDNRKQLWTLIVFYLWWLKWVK
jgi:asparagine synthase (glutamine-hydrolysing)